MKNKILATALCAASLASLLLGASSTEALAHKECENCESAAIVNDVEISSRIWELLFGGKKDKNNKKEYSEELMLIPGGSVFGARVKQERPSVTEDNAALGFMAGDSITEIEGTPIRSCAEVKKIVNESNGRELEITLMRGEEKITKTVLPECVGGEYRLGLSLRDGAAGIGTVTYIDPTTLEFGGLGHGICDPDSHEVVDISGGEVTGVVLGGVTRGECGKPGELRGILTERICGSVTGNTDCGLFGTLTEAPKGAEPIAVAKESEVKVGAAKIISTVKGTAAREYDIEITEITPSRDGTKCFKIKVTDPTLLALTGGIVRGMSGSPIIQNGKLVGAVTHVMVANPTEGYGIFIENMLNAAQSARGELPKAA